MKSPTQSPALGEAQRFDRRYNAVITQHKTLQVFYASVKRHFTGKDHQDLFKKKDS